MGLLRVDIFKYEEHFEWEISGPVYRSGADSNFNQLWDLLRKKLSLFCNIFGHTTKVAIIFSLAELSSKDELIYYYNVYEYNDDVKELDEFFSMYHIDINQITSNWERATQDYIKDKFAFELYDFRRTFYCDDDDITEYEHEYGDPHSLHSIYNYETIDVLNTLMEKEKQYRDEKLQNEIRNPDISSDRQKEIILWLEASKYAMHYANGFVVSSDSSVRPKNGSLVNIYEWLNKEGITKLKRILNYDIENCEKAKHSQGDRRTVIFVHSPLNVY